MILDKLMEKKDLHIYCRFRILKLKRERNMLIKKFTDDMSNTKRRKLHSSITIIKGRIRELNTIKGIALNNELKRRNKRMIRESSRKI